MQKNEEDSLPENERISQLMEVLETRGYTFLRQIGRGATADVYLVYSKKFQQEYVIKAFTGLSKINILCSESELVALKNLNSPNIVRVYDYVLTDKVLYFILEYCQHGSLKDYISKNGYFTGDTLLFLCKEMIRILLFIHDKHIAHLDIKPDNVLLDKYGRIKYCDFGYSKVFHYNEVRLDQKAGTSNYMAPEILAKGSYDPFKVDIYALGVTFAFLACGKSPWLIQAMKNMGNKFGEEINDDLFEIIMQMVHKDPDQRPSLKEIMEMPLFANFDKEINLFDHKSLRSSMLQITKRHTSMALPTVGSSNNLNIQLHVHNQPILLTRQRKIVKNKRPISSSLIRITASTLT